MKLMQKDLAALAGCSSHALLAPSNQERIAAALRQYQAGERGRMEEFKEVLRRRIAEKQRQYDAYMKNLASGALPPEVVSDVGREMQALKEEITRLQGTEPPKDFTVEQIRFWLNAIRANPDEDAVHLLIERITAKTKTDFSMESTLKSVLGEIGCGERI